MSKNEEWIDHCAGALQIVLTELTALAEDVTMTHQEILEIDSRVMEELKKLEDRVHELLERALDELDKREDAAS